MITATILRDQKWHQNSHCSHPKWHQNSTKTTSAKTAKNATKMAPKYQPKWHQSFNALYLHHQPKWHQNGTRFCIVSSPSASSSPKSHASCYVERIVVEKLHQDHINKNYREG